MRSKPLALRLLIALSGLFAGCGPVAGLNETRVAHAEPRAADCKLELLHIPQGDPQANTFFRLLGHITVMEAGGHDPLSYKMRDIVVPRACRMGGQILSISLSSENQSGMGSGAGTVYTVWQRKSGLGVRGTR